MLSKDSVSDPKISPKLSRRDASPARLRAILDEKVVGQDAAKEQLCMLFALHLMRYLLQSEGRETGKIPNAILIGPTGVGKTHSMRTMADAYDLPFVTADATSFVPAGIVGSQVEDLARLLYKEALNIQQRNNRSTRTKDVIRLAENGIIFIDEFDKLATPRALEAMGDAQRRLVQRRLLKVVEGDIISVGVPLREGEWPGKGEFLNSANWLVIVGGAFAHIDSDEIRRLRRNDEIYRQLFGKDTVVLEDIRNYGFLPELVARFPHIVSFKPLSPRDLLGVLTSKTESPLLVWQMYAAFTGIELTVEPEALAILSSRAAKLEMGARGLQALVFPILHEQFEECHRADCKKIVISAERLGIKQVGINIGPAVVQPAGFIRPESEREVGIEDGFEEE